MFIQDLIRKKRDKQQLTSAEIDWFIQELSNNKVEPAQTGAFLMASWINGLSEHEKINLKQNTNYYFYDSNLEGKEPLMNHI